jgi:hypothetical protein
VGVGDWGGRASEVVMCPRCSCTVRSSGSRRPVNPLLSTSS